MIEDWELGVLFMREAERLGSDEAAAQSVRHNFFDKMCARDRDTHFYMGTVFPDNNWIVGGIYWPPRKTQGELAL